MLIDATLNLFRAIPLKESKYKYDSSKIVKRTIKKGYVFTPEVFESYSQTELKNICDVIENDFTLSAEAMNATFHKSWKKVKTAPMIQLLIEQIFHYITTYGYEELGCYSKDTVYIPAEKLDIPEVENIPLIVIKGYTRYEIKDKINDLLASGIALKDQTMDDVVLAIEHVGLPDIENVKNKEVKMFLYKCLGQVPKNPVEFLRYVIFERTGQSLLIKDRSTIEKIKESGILSFPLFNIYRDYAKLSTIFYRFKPLFLALRAEEGMKPIINRIRKLAVVHHRPMQEDYLNKVTEHIAIGSYDGTELEKALSKANNFRKVRLANALKYRLLPDVESTVYRVRNGKGYAQNVCYVPTIEVECAYEIVLRSIADSMRDKVGGKIVYIPSYIKYILPATEKQFTGNFPSGTSIKVDKSLLFGVNWKNINGHRTDLDLSLMNATEKFGWDGAYSGDGILFSGDATDACGENGATELFYVSNNVEGDYLVHLNYFNYDENVPVPYKIVTGKKENHKIKKNYMLDPNNVIAVTNSVINKSSIIIGIASISKGNCRFYFSEISTSNIISSRRGNTSKMSRNYLINFAKSATSLKKVLELAGATVVREIPDTAKIDSDRVSVIWEPDIDLSPEKLEKDTIINLLT